MAIRQKIILILQPFDPEICVLANEELLCQILDNLKSNAARYAGSPATLTVERADRSVVIRVLDDGDGIAQNDLPHLFERRYKGKGGHFGIGLAIAASSAEKMNGVLSAANREASGACFTLFLPAQQSAVRRFDALGRFLHSDAKPAKPRLTRTPSQKAASRRSLALSS